MVFTTGINRVSATFNGLTKWQRSRVWHRYEQGGAWIWQTVQ
jgi:hypothetical protein